MPDNANNGPSATGLPGPGSAHLRTPETTHLRAPETTRPPSPRATRPPGAKATPSPGPIALVLSPAIPAEPRSARLRTLPHVAAVMAEHASATNAPAGEAAPAPIATRHTILASPNPRRPGANMAQVANTAQPASAHTPPWTKGAHCPVKKPTRTPKTVVSPMASRTRSVGTTRSTRSTNPSKATITAQGATHPQSAGGVPLE